MIKFNAPDVTAERVAAIADHDQNGNTTMPTDEHVKQIAAAYHPSDVIRTCLKYLSNDLELGQTDMTQAEYDLLTTYINERFNGRVNMDKSTSFYNTVQYILASEFAARALRVGEL